MKLEIKTITTPSIVNTIADVENTFIYISTPTCSHIIFITPTGTLFETIPFYVSIDDLRDDNFDSNYGTDSYLQIRDIQS